MASPITLLIMDDDEDDRHFFTEVVAQNNPTTFLAESHNGQEALHTLDNTITLPDIFLDLMPRLNGYYWLQQLKKNDRTSERLPLLLSFILPVNKRRLWKQLKD